MKKLLFLLLALMLCLGGCGEEKKENKDSKNAPKATLQLCSSLGERATKVLVEEFTRQHKIPVEVQYLPGGNFEQRMEFIRSHNFDCWLGGSAEEYHMAAQNKLLEPYVTKEGYRVPVSMRSKRGEWTSLYLGYVAMVSNKNKLRRKGLYAPDTWNELLDARLQNEIVMPYYELGGASFGMITSIWQLEGREKALEFASKLNEQKLVYVPSISEAVDKVYQGEKTVAVIPLSYALALEANHRHMFATIMKDANRNMLTCAALLRNGKHQGEGQEFLDFLMSDNSIQALEKNGVKYMWHVKNFPFNDDRARLIGQVRISIDDLAWTSTYKNEIIKKWREAK